MICLLRPVSQATLYIICFPHIVVVTYVNVDIHSFHLPDYETVLFKKSFIVRSRYKFVASI